ncbi:hypothetical protein niasHT_026089 [Heterodera trifolii]|uniref:VWFA domain-containing protein n=1 Tax=Heterodera trifolii TaxID=157864 RepID=A0ABD2KR59_9BILA
MMSNVFSDGRFPFELRSPSRSLARPSSESIRKNQQPTHYSSSSKWESAEETVEQRHISLISRTDDGTKGADGSQPKGFISTMKRNSLNVTSTVRNDNSGEDESGDRETGEKTAGTEEKRPTERRTKVKTKKAGETPESATSNRTEEPKEEAPKPAPMDVVLLLDGSSSITERVFKEQMLQFCREFAKQMGVSRKGNHLALVQFAGHCRTELGLTDYFNPKKLEEAISMVRYLNGGTRLGGALLYTQKKVMASARREPTIVNKVLVVVTDGASEDDVATPAKALRDDNVKIVVVGVGPAIVRQQLETVADGPQNVYAVEEFAQLNEALVGQLKANICEKTLKDEKGNEKDEEETEEQAENQPQSVRALTDAKMGKTKDETKSRRIFSEEQTFREF